MTLADWMVQNPAAVRWSAELNPHLDPEVLTPGSEKRATWVCEKGHQWESAIYSRTKLGRGCPYCAGQRVIPGENDLQTKHPEAAALWDHEKNGSLTPADVMPASRKRVWWKCAKGHSWEASVHSVGFMGTRCPCCFGVKPILNETDLASQRPTVAQQWVTDLNASLAPAAVTRGSKKKVWWECEKGHRWQAAVHSRTGKTGTNCPYCSNKKVLPGYNDLETHCPDVAQQWYEPLNAPLTPRDVTRGCKKKVWWQCEEGHVWKAAVYSRTREKPTGCPVCAGVVKLKATESRKARALPPGAVAPSPDRRKVG